MNRENRTPGCEASSDPCWRRLLLARAPRGHTCSEARRAAHDRRGSPDGRGSLRVSQSALSEAVLIGRLPLDDSVCSEVVWSDGSTFCRLCFKLGPELVESVLREGQEDQTQHRPAVLGGVRLELARSWSAAAQSLRSSSGRSVAVMC